MSDDQISRNYFGDNYAKAMKSVRAGKDSARRKFLKKYPYADMSKFKIFVNLNKDGSINSTEVDYIIDENTLVDTSTDSFKNNKNYNNLLEWPSPWGIDGTVQDFIPNVAKIRVNQMKIFVTEELFFHADFENFDISYTEGLSNNYKENSYLAALYAAYIATYLCGISVRHFKFKPSVPKMITSIARYHLYYHMMRFLRDPTKMSKYISGDTKKIVLDNKPVKIIWESKFHQGSDNLGSWLSTQAKGTVRNAKPIFSHGQGQAGIRYEKAVGKSIVGLDDYMTFIAIKSDGLTDTGQLLLQQSIESYVYCVLGAQAKTRWPIVESGARSLQTQEVFKKLVGDTVLQDDHTVTLGNMRGAIKSTNVVLNTAVSPGIILIPSNMIILDEMIEGYNNILTIAKSGMKFGQNKNVNYFKHDTIRIVPETKKEDVDNTTTPTVSTVKKVSYNPPIEREYEQLMNKTGMYVMIISGLVGSVSAWLFLL